MAQATYSWPKKGAASVLGKEVDRLDGIAKSTGAAKYTYDIKTKKPMLLARGLGCPHAHCKVKSIDTAAAERVPGVASVHLVKKVGDEIRWQGDLIAVVAGESEGAAAEGLAALKVDFEMLDVFVADDDLEGAKQAGRTGREAVNTQGIEVPDSVDEDDEDAYIDKEIARRLAACDVIVEGEYGIHSITHMCLEPHGSTCEWDGDKLIAHLSTQNVSGTGGQLAAPVGITADDVTVHCDYVGGGFGSKFAADVWGAACAEIAKQTGRGVKLMLDRDVELKIAGNRPSGFIKAKIGADSNGLVKVWDSHHWGTSGMSGGGVNQSVVPYVFDPPVRRRRSTPIRCNTAPQRAWRAPNHPQACALTQTAYDDIARSLGIDSYDVFLRNLVNISNSKRSVYEAEMEIAAGLMDWKAKWHPHGGGRQQGSVVEGLGMALHTWGGTAGHSSCTVKIHPDGGVETFLGTQDLGTGTRTVIAMVLAETFGLSPGDIGVNIGSSKYPSSGPSGGSTTVGGVSESNRRAGQDSLTALFEKVSPHLETSPADLEATGGRVQVRGRPRRGMTWAEACSYLGMQPIETTVSYRRGDASTLSSSQVGGVQMAHVAVDKETGEVKMKKYVSVQDMGLIINHKLASSQIYGAAIMGIAYALFEERIMDRQSGAFVNADLANYKLPRLGDIGEIVVHLHEPASEYERGVVGLGEPPVISPGAAISNAVCNALGVRIGVLPMTPKRVLDALQNA